MVKSFFFTFIGLMLNPPWALLGVGAVLGLVLLAVRWPTAQLALRGAGFAKGERDLVWVCMPRGMAAGVLAIMPSKAGVAGMGQLPVVVFSCVVVTILAFAVGMPWMSARLGGDDEEPSDVPREALPSIMGTEGAPVRVDGEENPTIPLT
jgi:hypothetical protein